MDSNKTAGQFNIDSSGQLFQLVFGPDNLKKHLYLTVASEKSHGGKTLATSFSDSPNKLGKFVFQGDSVIWTGPIQRQQSNACMS
jgi:hypothetical protein